MAVLSDADIVSKEIATRGYWELKYPSELLHLAGGSRGVELPRPGTFLDIGANLGFYTLLFAQHGYSVLAVEPMLLNRKAIETSLCLNPQFMSSGRVGPQYCPSHFAPPPINGILPNDPHFAFLPMLYREGCKGLPRNADASKYPECFGTIIEVAEPNRGTVNPPVTPTKYTEGTSWQGGMNPRYTKYVGGVTKRWAPP